MAKLTRAAYKAARDLRITSNANNEITGSIDRDDRGDLIDSAVLSEDGTEGLGDMPVKTGNGLKTLRLNSGATAYELVEIWKTKRVSAVNVSGAVSVNLATAEVFILTLTADVTSFDFINEVVGQDYEFVFIIPTANTYTLTFTAGKFQFSNGNTYQISDPILLGQTSITDVVTAKCLVSGKLALLEAVNFINN